MRCLRRSFESLARLVGGTVQLFCNLQHGALSRVCNRLVSTFSMVLVDGLPIVENHLRNVCRHGVSVRCGAYNLTIGRISGETDKVASESRCGAALHFFKVQTHRGWSAILNLSVSLGSQNVTVIHLGSEVSKKYLLWFEKAHLESLTVRSQKRYGRLVPELAGGNA